MDPVVIKQEERLAPVDDKEVKRGLADIRDSFLAAVANEADPIERKALSVAAHCCMPDERKSLIYMPKLSEPFRASLRFTIVDKFLEDDPECVALMKELSEFRKKADALQQLLTEQQLKVNTRAIQLLLGAFASLDVYDLEFSDGVAHCKVREPQKRVAEQPQAAKRQKK